MDRLTIKQIVEMLKCVCRVVIENEPLLTEIDIQTGDGDHGTGMKRGFSSVLDMLQSGNFNTVQEIFKTTGATLLDSMGGASGVLFATLFISGIPALGHYDFLTVKDLSDAFNEGAAAISKRGGASAGDKTIDRKSVV